MKDFSSLTRAELIDLARHWEQKNAAHEVQQAKHRDDLGDSAERLRAILDTAVEGIITINERGLIESFNPAAEKIFGYLPGEIIGQNVKTLMPEPFRHQHDGYLKNYHDSGQAKIIGIGREVVGRRKDGTVFPMDLAVSEVRLANRRIFTGFVRDITERKAGEKALLHYAALVESSDDAIIGKTIDGRISSWNWGAVTIFGFTPIEAVGQDISLIIPPDRMHEEQMIMEKIRRGESVDHYETVRRRKDGRAVNISVTVSPIREAGGKIVGASKVARDITERKRLENEITQISEREQRRIGQDLHDGLCQELAGIELLCQVLEKKLAAKSKAESKQAGEIARYIREATMHTRKLSHSLSPVELESNGLASALQQLAVHVEQLFGIHCRFDCAALVLVRDNLAATHLYRIAQEATNNAIKHGKAKHVVITVRPAGDQIALEIADDGAGFMPGSHTRSGMGMYTMKYRAGVVNATLDVSSTVGKGTTVTCVFRKNL